MFSVLKKISDFAGTRRGLLKKSMAVAFLGAVFAALQFAALMLTLDILVGGADLRIWPVIGVDRKSTRLNSVTVRALSRMPSSA